MDRHKALRRRDQVSVADTAKAAILKLEREP
jgi:hypothetical protein